ncbi:C40 family peptidase [Nonomuraea sp. NPDC050556]|uniref:C40 family peptidase n=1 Tax=Nonomuraea sp. NPDC050556 TaxID=3364369 RepID=UPI0037B90FCB
MIVEAGVAKLVAAGGGLVSSVVLIAGLGGGAQVASVAADQSRLANAVCAYAPKTEAAAPSARHGLTASQVGHARTIVQVAIDLKLPRRAAEIAIATALQESWLNNATVGDHGTSFGLFQQRPTMGWGTREQVTTPSYAAKSFYQRLIKVQGWADMPLTKAAAIVQRPRSDLRGAYAKHEPLAKQIVASLWKSTAPLPKADEKAVRLSIETAASLGIPRQALVDDIAANLGPKGSRKAAESIVAGQAQKLCKQLKAKLSEATTAIAAGSTRGALAVAAALTMRGVPYSWGGGNKSGPTYGIGRGASTRGFDCSGLAEYAWGKAGVSVGGHTSSQWTSGVRVPRSQIQPGDLIFFATNPNDPATIHHVGIALDSRRMVHAPFTGSSVRVETWADVPRRESEFAGAIRPRG